MRNTRLFPVEIVLLGYIAAVSVLVVIAHTRIPEWPLLLGLHLAFAAAVALIATWEAKAASPNQKKIATAVHVWYVIPLICLLYGELRDVVHGVHPHDFDLALAALDYRLFGVHPTVWLERWTWPWLTEVLQLVYATYYFLPILLCFLLWREGDFERLNYWLFIAGLGLCLSYLGYFAVPATGPRFLPTLMQLQTKPLQGVWLFNGVRNVLDSAEGFTRDCFPSGHTATVLLVAYYARKLYRPVFPFLLPFCLAIVFSTVYLRYHYVVDVMAGAALTGLVIAIADPIYCFLKRPV